MTGVVLEDAMPSLQSALKARIQCCSAAGFSQGRVLGRVLTNAPTRLPVPVCGNAPGTSGARSIDTWSLPRRGRSATA